MNTQDILTCCIGALVGLAAFVLLAPWILVAIDKYCAWVAERSGL